MRTRSQTVSKKEKWVQTVLKIHLENMEMSEAESLEKQKEIMRLAPKYLVEVKEDSFIMEKFTGKEHCSLVPAFLFRMQAENAFDYEAKCVAIIMLIVEYNITYDRNDILYTVTGPLRKCIEQVI